MAAVETHTHWHPRSTPAFSPLAPLLCHGIALQHEIAVQDELAAMLAAAAGSHALASLDVRGAPLSGLSLEAARHLLLTDPHPLRALRVTVATPAAADALADAAIRAPRDIQLQVSLPPGVAQKAAAAVELPPAMSHPSAAEDAAAAAAVRGRGPPVRPTADVRPVSQPGGLGERLSRGGSAGSHGSGSGTTRRQPFPAVQSATPSLKPRVSTLPAKMHARAHVAGISGGGAADRAALAFTRADAEGAGAVSTGKLARALTDLGLLSGLQPGQVRVSIRL